MSGEAVGKSKDYERRDEDVTTARPVPTIENVPQPPISKSTDGDAITKSCSDGDTSSCQIGEQSQHEKHPGYCDPNTNAIEKLITNEVSSVEPATSKISSTSSQQLSKNQLKKRRRMEKAIEIKHRKKQQKKQVRYEQAKAQGRDIDTERMQQEEARIQSATNVNRIKRIQEWQAKMMPTIQQSFEICIDCSYESYMTPKEINSLAIQIRYCYSSNKRTTHPCQLTATSIGNSHIENFSANTDSNTSSSNENDNCITLNHLRKVNGFDEWSNYAFQVTSDSFEQHFQSEIQNVVYLTSDSENTITTLQNDKIYVIGGIVDRNRYKQLTYNRATALGIATAKLPIDEYLSAMPSTRVLTTNHVFDLLIKYKEYNRCWKKALADVLPIRKDAKFAEEPKLEEADSEN